MRIGYFLSSEEFAPRELVRQARLAEDHGMSGIWISDHFHPWNDEQGESPFVWTTIGAIMQATDLHVTTAVTCPTVRIHPAIIAQAAATAGALGEGRFTLGVGSGEALNETIFGDNWPSADVRLDMLEEAIEVIRELFTGDVVHHVGDHYEVEHARLYTLPEQPVPIYMSGFGTASATLAGRIADGFINTKPDRALVKAFRVGGGTGKPMGAGTKFCWAPTKEQGVETAHRLWANEELPGELAQLLPTPEHFEQASQLVTPEMVGETVPCGPDPQPYVEMIRNYADAGFDELYVQQIGPDQDEFFTFFAKEVEPLLA
ncbi:MAG: TIGR03557 family F420-dependent LLM class oxidoreductase [Acidothermaceae bacterium]